MMIFVCDLCGKEAPWQNGPSAHWKPSALGINELDCTECLDVCDECSSKIKTVLDAQAKVNEDIMRATVQRIMANKRQR